MIGHDFLWLISLSLVSIWRSFCGAAPDRPNMIYIIMDDMGFSDMSSRGGEFETPHLDELYNNSINLQYHYIGLLCSPSRSQILTGRYAWNLGLSAMTPFGYTQIPSIPAGLPTIANLLREYGGYDTYAIGKWHAGYATDDHTPLYRGFDEFYGFLGTGIYYSNKTATIGAIQGEYIDWWANENLDYYTQYIYSTFVSRNKAVSIIDRHASNDGETRKNPFYIYLAFQAPHATLQNVQSDGSDTCDNITNSKRFKYCQNIVAVDNSVGTIVDTLKQNDLYDNTLIVFTSDNGGMYGAGGCNYPLRAGKSSFYDGGVRTLAFVSGGYVSEEQRGTTRHEFMHGSDWTPTLLGIAGLDINEIDHNVQRRIKTNTAKISLAHQEHSKNNWKNTGVSNSYSNIIDDPKTETQLKMNKPLAKQSVRSDFASFDGFDLSQWLLYGDSEDNPRLSVGLSINDQDLGLEIAHVFISEITGHWYKFMDLSTAPSSGTNNGWCTFCDGKTNTNWEPYRCVVKADGESTSQLLYDLTLDFNETTNLMTSEMLGSKLNVNVTYGLKSDGIKNNTKVQIESMDDYFNGIINDETVEAIWQEGLRIAFEYTQESKYFNNYLSCAFNGEYFTQADPQYLGDAWRPFLSFNEYINDFNQDCEMNCNEYLAQLYLSRYEEEQ